MIRIQFSINLLLVHIVFISAACCFAEDEILVSRTQQTDRGKVALSIVAGSPMRMDGSTNGLNRFHERQVSIRSRRIDGLSNATNELVFAWFVDLVLDGHMIRGDVMAVDDDADLTVVIYRGDQLLAYRFPRTNAVTALPSLPLSSRSSENFERCLVSAVPGEIRSQLRNIMKATIESANKAEMRVVVESTAWLSERRYLVCSFKDKQWTLLPLPEKEPLKGRSSPVAPGTPTNSATNPSR